MSNPSLKEQLTALSLGSSSSPSSLSNQHSNKRDKQKINHPIQGKPKGQKQKPTWLEHAQYGVELLKAYFPNCFKDLKEVCPLKVGIKQDLVKYLSTREDIVVSDKACMVNSLSYYVNSIAYHKSMVAGAMRIDLDGCVTTSVTVEEAEYSATCRKTKLQKKQSSDSLAQEPA